MKVNQVIEVEVTGQGLFDEIKRRFCVGDYYLIEGVLCRYNRVSWNDYGDTVVIDLPPETVKGISERLILLEQLKEVLNDCRNPYKEPDVIK